MKIVCKTEKYPEGISFVANASNCTITTVDRTYNFKHERFAIIVFKLLKSLPKTDSVEV